MPPSPTKPSITNLPTGRMPLAQWHARHHARFDEFHGWQVPVVYSTEEQEVEAARTRLALSDVSFIPKLMVRGPGVNELATILTGSGQASRPGRAFPLKADPSVLVCHLHTDQLLIVAGPSSKIRLDQLLIQSGKTLQLLHTDITSALTAFWLFGPHIDEVFRQVTRYDVASMPAGSCAETGLAGVRAILIRPPASATPSMCLLTGWDVAEYVWEKLWIAGKSRNLSSLGMDGLDALLNQARK
jgi:aminomethyltransferase